MGVLKTAEVEKNILSKGFRRKEGNHKFFHFYYNGKKSSIFTKTSHSSKELDDYLIMQMSKQLKLEKAEFIKFANCTLSESAYIDILIHKGFLKE